MGSLKLNAKFILLTTGKCVKGCKVTILTDVLSSRTLLIIQHCQLKFGGIKSQALLYFPQPSIAILVRKGEKYFSLKVVIIEDESC